MTLDEAIEHASEVERTCEDTRCAKEHEQLADWLRELRRARMEIDLLKTLRDGFKADARKYKAENTNLKRKLEILKDHGIEIADAVAGGFEIYNKEHARADQLKGENDKLRKLVLEIWRSCPVSEDDCAKCPHHIEESEEVSCDIPILMEKLGVVMDS